jgi:hypothetical protein
MKEFKFFNRALLKSHDGHDIHVDEWFYTVNKEDMRSPRLNKLIPKYTIVQRFILKQFEHKFRPDHEKLWYFKSRENAYWLIEIWKRQDQRNN